MATSGSTAWELTRNEIITRAYSKLGIPGEDNSLTTTQITDGSENLNAVIQLAVTDGMPLWKRTTVSETPSATSQVYTITDAMKIAAVYIRDTTSGVSYALREKSLYDFKFLPTLSGPGIPVHWTAQPIIQGYTVSMWPLLSDTTTVSSKVIDIIYQKEYDNMVSSTDTLDFPAYWTLALTYKLASILAPEWGAPLPDRQALRAEAAEYWAMAKGFGDEDGSLFIQMEHRYGPN
jgi:hypothetical protein